MIEKNEIEVVFSFDTTGSMYPCISQLRRKMESVTKELFDEIPNLKIGLIAHGDYCDEHSSYVIKELGLTNKITNIIDFIRNCGNTYGGDAPECYELVLHNVRNFKWSAKKNKVLVLIGDDVPHGPNQNPKHLDWRNELDCLLEMGIHVYGVQALNRKHANYFYDEIAQTTGGFKLNLDQFSEIVDLIKAICYRQVSDNAISKFIEKNQKSGASMSRTMLQNYATLLNGKSIKLDDNIKKRYEKKDLTSVPIGRFQVMDVDSDCSIKEFVEEQGLTFKPGRGFYEFTKSVKIQDYKEIILQDRITGDFFQGDRAREIIGIPKDTIRICPSKTVQEQYIAFIQSTSYNRKLIGGTKFLYEVEDWDK